MNYLPFLDESSLTMDRENVKINPGRQKANRAAVEKRLKTLEENRLLEKQGGGCMRGSIGYHEQRDVYYIQWYLRKEENDGIKGKKVKIYYRNGDLMYSPKIAEKLLNTMRSDHEKGTFRIEKYTRTDVSDIKSNLESWLEIKRNDDKKPGTIKDYTNSIYNHIIPFFATKHPQLMLNDIKSAHILMLKASIKRAPKGKFNVVSCFQTFMGYCKDNDLIHNMPKFPSKKSYGIKIPPINWLCEADQIKVIEKIPPENQDIFWWLKYHLRRPNEAFALRKSDYKKDKDAFEISYGVSARQLVDLPKDDTVHDVPCHSEFKERMKNLPENDILSPFYFTCKTSRQPGKRYTDTIFNRLWNKACEDAGIDLPAYSGLKHSSCSQYINEKKLSESELQVITGHARLESVRRYGKTDLSRKRELLETKKVVDLAEEREKRQGNE